MEFSESYQTSSTLGASSAAPCFSPDGRYLASVVEYRLVIREADSLRVVQAMWTPDGLGVLILAQFNIRTTLWSLTDRKCTYLRGPKHPDKGLSFSPDGTRLAVLERHDFKDHLTLYTSPGWRQVAHVQCDTSDAHDLAWDPTGRYLAVWDSCLEYRVCFFGADGEPLSQYSAYQGALGVRSVAWAPSGEVVAVGSYDQTARLLSHVTWLPIMDCEHKQPIEGPEHVAVYREASSRYVVDELPASIPSLKLALEEPNPKLGVGLVRWSPDGQFLVTRNENMPGALWVWDMAAMELSSVLCHGAPVLDAQWAPTGGPTLAAVTGGGKIFMWTPAGASIVHIPLRTFCARGLAWSPRGGALCLLDANTYCCAYMAGGLAVA